MSTEPDYAPHAALPPLERTDPGRRREAYIPDRPPVAHAAGTSDALRDLAAADLAARSRLPRPPAGFHWMPHIELLPSEVDLYERYAVMTEGIGARLVYRLVRDER